METATEKTAYKVKAGSFEGPLDVLLSLIEARKLFVNEISLAEVANDYILYIKGLEGNDANKRINDISAFIIVAATLILIKSKSLLPNLELTDEEEEKIIDLEERLRLYKIIKEVTIEVKNAFGTKIIFSAPERNFISPIFTPDPQITKENMLLIVQEAFARIPKEQAKNPEVSVASVMSIDEMIGNLTDRIQNAVNISFRDFSKSHGGTEAKEVKVHVIVSFLAMLELVREGIIDVVQNNSFDDITMQTMPTAEEGTNNIQ